MEAVQNRKKVVVVGGGFAGINFIKKMGKSDDFEITLVDRNNYHFFPPLLYQVATAFIEPSNITYPYRRLFQGKRNVRFHLGSLVQIHPDKQMIETDTGMIDYDLLVLAVGTVTNFFGMENVQRCALPMKTIDDSLNMRNHILLNLEKAVRTNDMAEREKLLTVVIAGGGPTGVELAGMLAEMGQHIIKKEYPEFVNLKSRIFLVDAGSAVLSPMSKKAQAEAYKVLQHLGVNIILNTPVKDYVEGKVLLGNGETIATQALIWASGVTGQEVNGLPAESIARGRRIVVNELNAVKGVSNIYALGDICLQNTDPAFPNGHPQVAQVAIQQGELLAANLKKGIRGETPKAFRYNDKGSMAIISKHEAVADLPKVFFKGFIAWFIWLFIHILPIAGFRNKVWLLFNWFWAFITNDPTLRLIIRPRKQDQPQPEPQKMVG